jgi:hypothetical protein
VVHLIVLWMLLPYLVLGKEIRSIPCSPAFLYHPGSVPAFVLLALPGLLLHVEDAQVLHL